MKFTRPPAPWMKDVEIASLQKERDELRYIAHQQPCEDNWQRFRNVRNEIKKKINDTKTKFYKKALSSKTSKDVWKVIHRILNPSRSVINTDVNELNSHFNKTAQSLTGKIPKSREELRKTIESLPQKDNGFKLQSVQFADVEKHLNGLRNDCSTGYDNIPATFIKPVSEYLASPLTFIINNFISTSNFPKLWKTARISPIPKIDNPISPKDYRPIAILPILSKIYEKLVLQQMTVFIENNLLYHSYQSGYRKTIQPQRY